MKQTIGKGVIVLTLSGLVCKILGALFRLPLTHVIGIEGIGVFQLVMSVFSFALVLTSGGISVTLSKVISSERAKRKYGKINWYIYISISYCVAISVIFGLIFLFLSNNISILQGSEEAGISYKLFLPLLLFSSLASLFRGVYQGFENMTPTAVSQILEQLCKFVFGLFLAYVFGKKSISLGVAGAFIGIMVGEILAFAYLMLKKRELGLRRYKYETGERKVFSSYLFPATLATAISSFVHFADSLLIMNRLSIAGFSNETATALFGLQTGIVGSILNFPIIISLALATSILPSLAFDGVNKGNLEKTRNSFSVMWYAILPITLGLLAVSFPMYQIVYPMFDVNMLTTAVRLTAIGSVSTILLSITQFCGSVLQSRGQFKYVLISQIFGGVGKILCTFFLCSNKSINIYGLSIGNLVFALIVLIFYLIKIRNELFSNLDSFFIPVVSSLVMLVVVGYLSVILKIKPFLNLIVCFTVGLSIYIILSLPLFKSFKNFLIGKKRSGEIYEQNGTN